MKRYSYTYFAPLAATLATLFLLCGCLPDKEKAAAKERERIQAEVGAANELLNTGQTDAAIARLEKLDQAHPAQLDVLEALGFAYARLPDPLMAALYFDHAFELSPQQPDLALFAAQAHAESGQPEKAAQAYRLYLALSPDDAAAWRSLGQLEVQLQRNKPALDAYLQVLRLSPLPPASADLLHLARLYHALGNQAQAANWYEEQLKQASPREERSAALIGLFDISLRQKQWPRAIDLMLELETLDRAALTDGPYAQAYDELSRWHKTQQEALAKAAAKDTAAKTEDKADDKTGETAKTDAATAQTPQSGQEPQSPSPAQSAVNATDAATAATTTAGTTTTAANAKEQGSAATTTEKSTGATAINTATQTAATSAATVADTTGRKPETDDDDSNATDDTPATNATDTAGAATAKATATAVTTTTDATEAEASAIIAATAADTAAAAIPIAKTAADATNTIKPATTTDPAAAISSNTSISGDPVSPAADAGNATDTAETTNTAGTTGTPDTTSVTSIKDTTGTTDTAATADASDATDADPSEENAQAASAAALARSGAEAFAKEAYAQAAELLERAAKLDPTNHKVLDQLSRAAFRSGSYQKAERYAALAMYAEPKNLGYRLEYLRAYQRNHPPADLLQQMISAKEDFPNEPSVTLALARGYEYIAQRKSLAANIYREYLEQAPDSPLAEQIRQKLLEWEM